MPVRGRKKLEGSDKVATEKIRVELNIEKWPGIWQPAKAHTKLVSRTLERQVEMKDGSRAVSKLVVGFTDLGTLTTEDQRMFYALIRQWEDAGKPVGRPVYFSDRLLSRLLKKKGWGSNVITAITCSLRRLRTIPLRWIKSFHKNDPSASEYEEEIPFQILGDLKIITRKAHGHVTNQQGYFQFDRNIEANLHANFTKPLLGEVFFRLEGEIAQLLYTHLDLVMFGKSRYERCSKELFADLGLTGASYRFKSNRKQKLERALAELRGIKLNHGTIKSASIEPTQDGKDFKVVFTKGAAAAAQAELLAEEEPAAAVPINHYAQVKDQLQLQAEELVCYFHQVFHGVEKHQPQLKETSQAMSLLGQHGMEQCRHIVDFAYRQAQTTNYQIQHFGGILNYSSRALAAGHRQTRHPPEKPNTPKAALASLEPAKPTAQTVGQRRLSALTPEQYNARFDQARSELLSNHSALTSLIRQKPGSRFEQVTVIRLMTEQLESEPMDLLVPGSGADPKVVSQALGLPNLEL